MKKIFIIAYLRNNLGDDLFVEYVLNKYPHCKFYIWNNPKYLSFLKEYKNVVIPNKLLFFFNRIVVHFFKNNIGPIDRRWMSKANIILKIGGSIFMESESHTYNKVYRNKDRQPLFILGANFGPYSTNNYLQLVRNEIADCADACFRDVASYELFKDLHCARVAPDILFDFNLPASFSKMAIGISLVDVDRKSNLCISKKDYYDIICKVIYAFLEKGYKIKLFSFCNSEGDENAVNDVYNIVHSDGIQRFCYNGKNLNSFLLEFCSCELIVATRFHAMILGWAAKKKVFPIVYNIKMENVIKDVNYSDHYLNLLKKNTVEHDIIVEQIINAKKLEGLELLKNKSRQHFICLDKYIND